MRGNNGSEEMWRCKSQIFCESEEWRGGKGQIRGNDIYLLIQPAGPAEITERFQRRAGCDKSGCVSTGNVLLNCCLPFIIVYCGERSVNRESVAKFHHPRPIPPTFALRREEIFLRLIEEVMKNKEAQHTWDEFRAKKTPYAAVVKVLWPAEQNAAGAASWTQQICSSNLTICLSKFLQIISFIAYI